LTGFGVPKQSGGTSKIRVLKVQSGGPQNTKSTIEKSMMTLGLPKSLILLVPQEILRKDKP
jgi:hypothetical protein